MRRVTRINITLDNRICHGDTLLCIKEYKNAEITDKDVYKE
jgi:hypothetical protein